MARPFGWVFFYNSEKFVKTGLFRYRLAGNGPVMVNRQTGEIEFCGTNMRVEELIADYDRKWSNYETRSTLHWVVTMFTTWIRWRGRVESARIWRSSRDLLTYEDQQGRRVVIATERLDWGRVVYADTLQSWASGADTPMTRDEHETVRRRVEQFLRNNRVRFEHE